MVSLNVLPYFNNIVRLIIECKVAILCNMVSYYHYHITRNIVTFR